jgi:hypothetical protein
VTVVRARRCPGAIAAMWGWEAALGLVVAWPAASVVARAFGGDPHGDAALWEAGGHPLLALLERHPDAIVAELTFAGVALLFAAVAGLLPMAALMVVMLERSSGCKRAAAFAAARAVGAFPTLAVLLTVVVLAQGAAVGVGYLIAKLVELFASSALSEARTDTIEALVIVPVALIVAVLGIVHDLARAAAVRFRVGVLRALSLAAQAFRRAPWSSVWGWTWREGSSVCVVIGGALVAGAFGGRRGLALVVLTIAHQATVAARAALRASWLAKALRTVAE